MANELAFIGSPINDEDLTLAMLIRLGLDYNSFIVFVNTAHHSEALTFSNLHGLLISHEALLQSQYTSNFTLPSLSSPSIFVRRSTDLNESTRDRTDTIIPAPIVTLTDPSKLWAYITRSLFWNF
jgi:hypothetical protein